VSNSEWLAAGGAYLLIGVVWIGSAIAYAMLGLQAGKAVGAANDGCLLGITNVFMAFLGGGIGYLLAMTHFPGFIVTSMVGALVLPALSTWYFYRKSRPR
jgi:hypothetical protein